MWHSLQDISFWLQVVIYGGVALFFLVMAVLFLATLAACLWEKQRVRDFTPATPDLLPPPSPYFQAMNEAARELGFLPGGLFRQDRNGFLYGCCLTLWLSPDRNSLLCIAGGKVARVNYKRTTLVSRLAGEKSLVTMDEFGTEDLSGTRDVQVLMNADLRELNQLHVQRLASAGVEAQPFTTNDLLADFEAWNRLRADRLVAGGLAKYLSPDCNTWRYTPKGAWSCAITAQFKAMQKAKAQKERMKIKRPGG